MKLGHFSISLSVKDLAKSKAFYEKLGFTQIGGAEEHNYLILDNEGTTIGLFQGMFEGNILTFNPGWGPKAVELDDWQDVREIQQSLEKDGVELITRAEPDSEGPASFTLTDPDGNSILFDQHR